jgi:hypothetical protein
MQTIEDIASALNARLEDTSLRDFYALRTRLNGGRPRHGGLFQVIHGGSQPLKGYAFHWGGRSELQFNIGFEDGGHFRYGVAFSLEPDRNLPDPVSVLRPKIEAFNTVFPRFDALNPLRMWWYQNHRPFPETSVQEIPDSLLSAGTFIFVGEGVGVAQSGVTGDIIDRAASVLASLLPLYEEIERMTRATKPGAVQRSARTSSIPRYVARLAYNSRRWWCPTLAAEVRESGSSYRTMHGFGHEDWLFRSEWLLDGWRYGFVQGVNKSRNKLLRDGTAFDLRLFTVPTAGDRRAVAEIGEAECLSDEAAAEAVAAFERLGWLDTMRAEVRAAGGDATALDRNEYAPFVLNLRYRLDNLSWLDADVPLPPDDPIHKIKRYSLCEVAGAMDTATSPAWRGRNGNSELPEAEDRQRFVPGGWKTYSPEHIRMQRTLVDQLRRSYPEAEIVCERDFVDVMVRTDREIMLFEVKSDLRPLSVVRQALGQVLEYAYHPRRIHDLPVQLVIAGRRPLEGDDLAYFEQLKQRFALPIAYWQVPA